MSDSQDIGEARPAPKFQWNAPVNDPRNHRVTWRLVATRVLGAWRWALLRAWCATDDGWIYYLEWGDDHVRGGMLAGWYEYDERWIQPVDPLPPGWTPTAELHHRSAGSTHH